MNMPSALDNAKTHLNALIQEFNTFIPGSMPADVEVFLSVVEHLEAAKNDLRVLNDGAETTHFTAWRPEHPGGRWNRSELIAELVNGLDDVMGLATLTTGGQAIYRRSQAPKVGDLVKVLGVLLPPVQCIGWLRAMRPGRSVYHHEYEWVTPDGRWVKASNVRVGAVPVGNRYSKWLDNIDLRFQPHDGEEK